MHLWDVALMKVLPEFYEADASPQTLYRIKKRIVEEMRTHMKISKAEERQVRVEWMAKTQSVNLVIPPNLLTRTLH